MKFSFKQRQEIAMLLKEELITYKIANKHKKIERVKLDKNLLEEILQELVIASHINAMGVEGVDQMDQATYRKAAVDAVRKLSEDVGIPSKLEALKEEDLPFLAESAHADACAPGNPKDIDVEGFKDLFRKIM